MRKNFNKEEEIMDWYTIQNFLKRGLDAVATSLLSTVIFTTIVSIGNSIKASRQTKKIASLFEKTKTYFKELCDGTFVITSKCIENRYTISSKCVGTYKSLLSGLESQQNQLTKLSKYSFVRGKMLDNIIDAISVYDSIIYKLSTISVTELNGGKIKFSDFYKDDVTNEINELNKFFKLTEVN